ncbi:MAG: bifunctional riboflavin kinase/FAD synthetase [Lentimicrobiaceae bacterium]|nr:bifunctional riboflavin kinase/FAD synthetase [Lentimicrobiaceae bacterium]
MKLYHNWTDFDSKIKYNVAIGSFDGIHLTHKKVLKSLTEISLEQNIKSCVITFVPPPEKVLYNDINFKLLLSEDEKQLMLEQLGVDALVVVPFNRWLADLNTCEFLESTILKNIKIDTLFFFNSDDFLSKMNTNINELRNTAQKNNFKLIEIPDEKVNNTIVKSADIKDCINLGNIPDANKLLSYDYFISGTVVKGNQLGRKMGFPTANIKIDNNDKLIPKIGVYACYLCVNDEFYKCMTNIGYRPTIDEHHLTIETNIFDFDEDIYDKDVRLFFVKRLRDEIRFKNLEALIEQLHADKQNSKDVLDKVSLSLFPNC